MSEGIFGNNADLAQRLKDRIAFHANEHRHTYEIGKGVPPEIQYSIFEGGDVFVCPFCCADLARTEAGIPRKCPECGQPIERKQSHDRKKA